MMTDAPLRDRELAFVRGVGRRLPPLPHATALINRVLKPWYLRKERPQVVADVLGFRMRLNPAETTEGALLFYPHLYDRHEIAFLRGRLQDGDTFLDVGANVGYYSLVASRAVGGAGRVLAIEADPQNFDALRTNLRLNDARNVCALNVGVSDRQETLRLNVNVNGNRGGNSFLFPSPVGVDVPCRTLLDLLRESGVGAIAGAKFDIEGFEYRVLARFLGEAEPALLPSFLIVEFQPEWREQAGGDVIALLLRHGYRVHSRHLLNSILVR